MLVCVCVCVSLCVSVPTSVWWCIRVNNCEFVCESRYMSVYIWVWVCPEYVSMCAWVYICVVRVHIYAWIRECTHEYLCVNVVYLWLYECVNVYMSGHMSVGMSMCVLWAWISKCMIMHLCVLVHVFAWGYAFESVCVSVFKCYGCVMCASKWVGSALLPPQLLPTRFPRPVSRQASVWAAPTTACASLTHYLSHHLSASLAPLPLTFIPVLNLQSFIFIFFSQLFWSTALEAVSSPIDLLSKFRW